MSEWLAALLAAYSATCGFAAGWRIRESQITPPSPPARYREATVPIAAAHGDPQRSRPLRERYGASR